MTKKPAVSPVKSALPLHPEVLRHHLATLEPMLQTWAEKKSPNQVTLLTGPEGVGKRSIALYLTQWLGCKESPFSTQSGQSTTPCGQCIPCKRMTKNENFDFVHIAPESTSEGRLGSIKVEAIHALVQSQGFSSYESPYKVILISNAGSMTPQSANSLLKILEEPPKKWIFFLTASDPTLLLPTIVSRCQQVRLRPLPAEILERFLSDEGVATSQAALLANLAQGSLGRAIALSDEESIRLSVLEFLGDPGRGFQKILDSATTDAITLGRFIDGFESLIHDLVILKTGDARAEAKFVLNSDKVPLLKKALTRLATQSTDLHDLSRQLAQMRRGLALPLNRKLVIQEFLGRFL